MNSKELFYEVISKLDPAEGRGETTTIAAMLLEKALGLTRADIMAGRMADVSNEVKETLNQYINRVNAHEPVQYVLGEAYFFGRMFAVNSSVLIPRPETEELVRAVLEQKRTVTSNARILDVGAGSGCIAVTLSLEWHGAEVFAADVDARALAVARENARTHSAHVNFFELDILGSEIPVGGLDVVVSNPPYIAQSERASMSANVLDHEPHIALFIPDEDPLLFYREIANKSMGVMNPGGLLAFEVNERFGEDVCEMLRQKRWKDVSLIKDISGTYRIATARLGT